MVWGTSVLGEKYVHTDRILEIFELTCMQMGNTFSSVQDPLFYMHHANIDRIWWIWQNKRASNLYDMGGVEYPNGTGTVTLDYPLKVYSFLGQTVPIRQVMDTLNQDKQGLLCYHY